MEPQKRCLTIATLALAMTIVTPETPSSAHYYQAPVIEEPEIIPYRPTLLDIINKEIYPEDPITIPTTSPVTYFPERTYAANTYVEPAPSFRNPDFSL